MREPLDTPKNREIMQAFYGKKSLRELESMLGYKHNSISDFGKRLGLQGKYKTTGKRVLVKAKDESMEENYDPQTYVDPYITDNKVYDDNVYAYRNGYVLRNDSLLHHASIGAEFALAGSKRPHAGNYFI